MSTTPNIQAYCYQGGKIGFTSPRKRRAPEGTIVFASGPARILKKAVSIMARHAYDGKTLLVPGLPECLETGRHWITGEDPVKILGAWSRQVRERLENLKADPAQIQSAR